VAKIQQDINVNVKTSGTKQTAKGLQDVANNAKLLGKTVDFQNIRMLKLSNALKQTGKDWTSLNITMAQGKEALKGNALAINLVDQQLIKLNKTSLLSVRNTRNTHGAFSVLRSKLLLVSFAVALVNRAIISFVTKAAQQEAVNQKLAAGLANIADTTPGVTQRLVDYSAALEQTTAFGDELVTNGMAQLTTFTLNEKAIKALTPQVLNVARAIQTTSGQMPDLNSLFIAFGKSTSTAVSALTRYGVVLTDTEKKQLEAMGANERAGAIAEILDKQYGGLADAYRESTAGMLEAATAARGTVAESFGAALAPAVVFATKLLVSFLGTLNPGKVKRFAVALTAAATAVLLYATYQKIANVTLTKFIAMAKRNPYMVIFGAVLAVTQTILSLTDAWGDGSKALSDHDKRVKKHLETIKLLTEEQAENLVSLEDRHKLIHNSIAQVNAKTHAEIDALKVQAMAIKTDHEESEAELEVMRAIVAHQRELAALKKRKKDIIALNEAARRDDERILGLLEATDAAQKRKLISDLEVLKTLPPLTKKTEDWAEAVQDLKDKLEELNTVEVKLTEAQESARSAFEGTNLFKEKMLENTLRELELQQSAISSTGKTAKTYKVLSEAIKNVKQDIEDLNEVENRNIEILETLGIAKEHGISIDEKLRQEIVKRLEKEREALITQLALKLTAEEYVKVLEDLLKVEAALGLADDPWEKRLDAMSQMNEAMGALSSTAGMYFSNQREGWAREMEDLKASEVYKRASSQRQEKMEKVLQDKQRSAKKTAWKQEQALNMSQIVMNTASAIMNALAAKPMRAALATWIGVMGAAQLGIVASQKMPKFAKGGDFIVPPGYPNDTFPMRVESGERVQITPKTEVGGAVASQSTVTVNFTGNVLSQDFIEDEAIPIIKEAVRRGADIGVA
jgi:hypothetical protein